MEDFKYLLLIFILGAALGLATLNVIQPGALVGQHGQMPKIGK